MGIPFRYMLPLTRFRRMSFREAAVRLTCAIFSIPLMITGVAAYEYFTQPKWEPTADQKPVIKACEAAFAAHPDVKVSFDHVARQYKQTTGNDLTKGYAFAMEEVLRTQNKANCETMFYPFKPKTFKQCFRTAKNSFGEFYMRSSQRLSHH